MPSKIERQPTLGKPSSLSSPTTPATVRTESVAATAAVSGPAAAQFGDAPPRVDTSALNPRGMHVGGSPEADALWGVAPAASEQQYEAQLADFKKLPSADQAKRLHELMGRREDLEHRIHQRTKVLDKRWKKLDVGTRSGTLRQFIDRNPNIDQATRAEAGALVGKADAAQRRMNEIKYQIATMPKNGRENAALRKKLSAELRALRKEQKDSIKAAAKLLDERGYKTDRLADAEGTIDPEGVAKGESLLGMRSEYLNLSWLITNCSLLSDTALTGKSEKKKADEKKEEQVRETDFKNVVVRAQLRKQLTERLTALDAKPS